MLFVGERGYCSSGWQTAHVIGRHLLSRLVLRGHAPFGQHQKSRPLDCEPSLFSSKIRWEERKTSKRTSVTVSVTCERRCRGPLVARASASLFARLSDARATSGSWHRRSHVTLTVTLGFRARERLLAVYKTSGRVRFSEHAQRIRFVLSANQICQT